MRSRTSCFNATVFRKNLLRFAPVWGVYTLCLVMGILLLYTNGGGMKQYHFARHMTDLVEIMALVNLVYAPIVAARETTVLISSHNLRELEDICDHVGIMDHGKMLLERSLADMQGATHKLQLVGDVPEGLEILHESASGRLKTLVVRGSAQEIEERARLSSPVYFDVLPLSLEEIFIYELGGVNYEVKDILL